MKYEFEDGGRDEATVDTSDDAIWIRCLNEESNLVALELTAPMARNLAKILMMFADELERGK